MNSVETQNISLENRKDLKLTGITKIESLNPLEVLLTSTLGGIKILGKDLEMQSFDIEKGNINIIGSIDSFSYFNKSTPKNNKGFIQKLFR